MTRSTKSAQGRIFSAASLFKSCVRYGTGDFSNLLVLAWTGLYWGLSALVCTFVFTSCFENHLECSGCFVAFLAKLSESTILLLSSLSSFVLMTCCSLCPGQFHRSNSGRPPRHCSWLHQHHPLAAGGPLLPPVHVLSNSPFLSNHSHTFSPIVNMLQVWAAVGLAADLVVLGLSCRRSQEYTRLS